jgi:hypothetical protein
VDSGPILKTGRRLRLPSGPTRAPAGAAEKTTQPRPSYELKTRTPATRSAWASGHFSGQTVGHDSSARFGVKPTGNRMLKNPLLMPPHCRRVANPKAYQNQLVWQPSRSCLRAARARRSFVWARRHRKHSAAFEAALGQLVHGAREQRDSDDWPPRPHGVADQVPEVPPDIDQAAQFAVLIFAR